MILTGAGNAPAFKTILSKLASAGSLTPVICELPPLIGGKHAAHHLGETLVGKRLEHYELVEFVGGG